MPSSLVEKIDESIARFALALLVWLTVNWIALVLFFKEPPASMRDLLIALAGSLTTVFIQQIQYYNKTGLHNDRQKDETINQMACAAAAAIPKSDKTIPLQPGDSVTVAADDNPTTPAGKK